MAISPKKLADATPQERLAFALHFLNLDVSSTDTDDHVTAKIKQAQPGSDMIFVNAPDSVAEVAAQETESVTLKPEEGAGRLTGTLGAGDPRATIFIPNVDTADGLGTRDVLVGVNGRAWQLKRGVDLDVPWRVVEALQNATADVVTHSQEPETLGDVNVQKAQRFGFSITRGPSQAEIEDWRARTGAEFCA